MSLSNTHQRPEGVNPTGLYSDRTVGGFPVHPDEIKRFATGQAYPMKATGERVVIQVEHRAIDARVAFPPPLPRTWNDRDRERVTRSRPAGPGSAGARRDCARGSSRIGRQAAPACAGYAATTDPER